MKTFTAYKNELNEKAFQTPEACLRDEFQCLRSSLVAAVNDEMIETWNTQHPDHEIRLPEKITQDELF